jgi:hypothetical protein
VTGGKPTDKPIKPIRSHQNPFGPIKTHPVPSKPIRSHQNPSGLIKTHPVPSKPIRSHQNPPEPSVGTVGDWWGLWETGGDEWWRWGLMESRGDRRRPGETKDDRWRLVVTSGSRRRPGMTGGDWWRRRMTSGNRLRLVETSDDYLVVVWRRGQAGLDVTEYTVQVPPPARCRERRVGPKI